MVVKVVAAVMEKDGRYFIARRLPHGRHAGKWEFPGGKVDPGEMPEESLRREMMEEFSIETEVGDFLGSRVHDYGESSIDLLAYRVRHISGDIVLNDHQDSAWATPEEMQQYDFVGADYFVIERLRSDG